MIEAVVAAPIGTAWDGTHQGFAHVHGGVYWEACFHPTPEERLIQKALLRTDMPSTQKRWEDKIFRTRIWQVQAKFRRL